MSPFESPREATTKERELVQGTNITENQKTAKTLAKLIKASGMAVIPFTDETSLSADTLRTKLLPLVRNEVKGKRVYSSIRPRRKINEKLEDTRDGFISFSTAKPSRKREQ